MRTERITLLLLAACVAVSACKPKPPVPVLKRADGTEIEAPPPADASAEESAKTMAREASNLRANDDRDGAKKQEDMLLERFPNTAAAAEIYEARAKQASEAGATDDAIGWYEKLLFYRPQFVRINEAREDYAQVLVDAGRPGEAAKMLRSIFEEGDAGPEQIRLGLLLADALADSGDGLEALDIVVRLRSQGALSSEQRDTIDQRAPALANALDYESLKSAWNRSSDSAWEFIAPAIGFKLAKMHYHVREYDDSREVLRDYLARYSSGPYGSSAKEFSERLEARFAVNTKAIGVLVPLSGRFKPFGERSLEAMKLALGKDSGYELIVRDTKADANVTTRAVEELVLEHNVVAIVGPLFSASALAAAQKAEELSVPLIALSYRQGLPDTGPWVFRTGLTVEAQAQGLAKVAFEELGFTRFALMWPRSRYGVAFATAFWREVEKRKGEIRAAEAYEHDETTFRSPVRRMVGRYYMYSRWDYRQGLQKLRAQKLPSHRYRAAVEKLQKELPPIVDFDAIVIPDTGKNIGLIAPALAVEDIVMTRDPKMLEKIRKATRNSKVSPVTLMGGSTWNHPLTPESCDRYCEEAVFVDAYYPDNPDSLVRDFVSQFRKAVGAEPVLSDAQAYDTARLLKSILAKGGVSSREAMRDAMMEMAALKGVTGTLKFDDNGEAIKELFVLTIDERTIELWKKRGPEG
ncbi:MAG: penicillin-binding protein activator [Myxococcota bacterium]